MIKTYVKVVSLSMSSSVLTCAVWVNSYFKDLDVGNNFLS